MPEKRLDKYLAVLLFALLHGAKILRVHDVKEAVECVKIVSKLK